MTDDAFRGEISEAIRAHAAWKHRLLTAARNNETDLPVQDICRDDKCRFGQWLAGVTPNDRTGSYFNNIKTLHSDFHKAAGLVAQKIADGNPTMAIAALEGAAYTTSSKELEEALAEWQAKG
ncbi:CZB domain-containing protein [Pseudophaeobacter sp. EL27]|uniref:CZB domain-containing protein n=1 Tax=Pseudophaeobacter sp. EL27 TaxID=2107580 RepID=UPI0013C48AC9|nr:CZB domain-containing protein [Pseudophaeobacter sp. EL27]